MHSTKGPYDSAALEVIELLFLCASWEDGARVLTLGPGDTIRRQRHIILLIDGVVAEFRQWARGLRPSDCYDAAAMEVIEL